MRILTEEHTGDECLWCEDTGFMPNGEPCAFCDLETSTPTSE